MTQVVYRGGAPSAPFYVTVVGLVLATFSVGKAQDRYALLIGTNEYLLDRKIPDLHYAEKDVADLARILEEQEKYKEVIDLSGSSAHRSTIIAELYGIAKRAKPEDTFLLYFAGHGVRDWNGHTYWLTRDARLDLLEDKGIRLSHLMDYVRDVPAKNKVVLLDHCFSGDVIKQGRRDSDGTRSLDPIGSVATSGLRAGRLLNREELETELDAGGMWIIAAARDYAYEDATLKHGLFTAAIIEALTTNKAYSGPQDKELSVRELFEFLNTRMPEMAGEKQRIRATIEGGLEDFVFSGRTPEDYDYYDGVFLRLVADGLIDRASDVCNKIIQVFAEWSRARNAGAGLDSGLQATVDKIKKAIDSHPTDEDRAVNLKLAFR